MLHVFNYETPFYIFKIKIKGESYMSILEIIEELNLVSKIVIIEFKNKFSLSL